MKDFGEIKTCKMGHHYYPALYAECPECNRNKKEKESISKPLWEEVEEDDDVTVTPAAKNTKIRPIAGWLVCVDGPMKGRDYRVCTENNFIGRAVSMDICIARDESISGVKHAIISFDGRTGKYYYTPGEGRNLHRVNEAAVFTTVELHNGDQLEIGQSKFVFIALCGTRFNWEDWEENDT